MERIKDNLIGKIRNLSGFKISNSHFRIGSKMHISEFYYAKRFFQNSFYATRVAYIIAEEIMRKHKGHVNDFRTKGVSLIGYGQYSELLLSLVEKFIVSRMRVPREKINHNLIDDSDNLELIKKEELFPFIILVVPIATTFSTSVKMEEKLMSGEKKYTILYPHLNIIHIYHKPGMGKRNPEPIEILFGWTEKIQKDKIVRVRSSFDPITPIKEQQYFIALPSTWHDVKDCIHCFPHNHESERPLYDTDKTLVTPTLIFDYPTARKLQPYEIDRKSILNPDLFRYGHHKRNSNHFHFYIDAHDFFIANRQKVRVWLLNVKKSEVFKRIYKPTDQVVLLAGGHHSNAAFVNLVNTILFSSAATIIHYDSSQDFAQNFKMIYREELKRADRIYFVDDALNSGKSFHRIFHFVQFLFDELEIKKEQPFFGRSMDGCLFLLNCSSDYDYKKVKWRFENPDVIFSYSNFHLPTASNSDGVSPLYAEQLRYLEIIKDTFLDSLKIYFLRQASKLEPTSDAKMDTPRSKRNGQRHLLMLLATHCTYEYFLNHSKEFEKHLSLRDFVRDVIAQTTIPIESVSLDLETGKAFELTKIEAAFLKVLTQYPFVQYKPLRNKCFGWTIHLLNHKSYEVGTAAIKNTLNYRQFKEFKFLVRRAGLLNSNYLINVFFFNVIEQVLNDDVLEKMLLRSLAKVDRDTLQLDFNEDTEQDMRDNILDFPIFLAAQIKELLFRNESRGVKLQAVIQFLKPSKNKKFNHFLRTLQEELVIMIRKFEEFISKREGWDVFPFSIVDQEKVHSVNYNNNDIIDILDESSIKASYKYLNIHNFLGDKELTQNTRFINYLWVLRFLEFDARRAQISHSVFERTAIVIDKIKEIITKEACGAFLVLNGVSKNVFVAYNKGAEYARGLDASLFNPHVGKDSDRGVIDMFNRGIGDHSNVSANSILEIHKTKDGWLDIESCKYVTVNADNTIEALPEWVDRLILVRLTKPGHLPDELLIQGTFGFFFKEIQNHALIDSHDRHRYLLLLREPLTAFFSRHHENNEFRELNYSMLKEKTALLTGHGREMLISISLNGDRRYREIVSTLLVIQRLIIDKKEAFEEIGLTGKKIDEIFKTYYKTSKEILTKEFYGTLHWLAEDIFKQEEIENPDKVNIIANFNQNVIDFCFSSQLLLLICFEILVNAKKNRWIFLPEEEFKDVNGIVYNMNHIWLDANLVGNDLKLTISNTGPAVDKDVLKAMNLKKNVKVYDKTSGIELIDTMLNMFDIGSMQYILTHIEGEFYKISCEVTLSQNNQHERTKDFDY